MINFKAEIAKSIADCTNIDAKEIESYIEIPPDSNMGDYAFPCFKLAKELKKAPPAIASEIKDNIKIDENLIDEVNMTGGYLNFFVNKSCFIQGVLEEVLSKKEDYGKSNIGNGKTVLIDYSSPNIAKPFHIGHLKTTVIGGALYNIYKFLGYNVIGINHLGDYGTQFGKLIEGYKLWGKEYDLTQNPIDKLADIYMRINNLCNEDENVLEQCRENFRLLEEGDEYCVNLWQKFKELSIQEFQKIYDLLGSKFDSWNGEAFYSDKTAEVIEILEKTGKLVESEGAKVVDLSDKGIDTPCMICKSNGSTIYATRDLAAVLYRARTYDFDKCLYVTSYEQNLHFKQIFEVAKLLGIDKKYTNGLEHVPYGFVRLSTGKMSTRLGNFVKVEDLLNDTINQAKKIIEEKNPELENKDEIAKKVGIGAAIFNDLSTNRIKDEVFDIDAMLNFQGETGPYIQYMYVRTKSVLEKANYVPTNKNIDFGNLNDSEAIEVIKKLVEFNSIITSAAQKNEPSIVARYLIELAKSYSNFYNEHKIIVGEEDVKEARLLLTYAVNIVLRTGASLLGMQMPDRM